MLSIIDILITRFAQYTIKYFTQQENRTIDYEERKGIRKNERGLEETGP